VPRARTKGRSAIYRLATASLLNGIGASIGGIAVPVSIYEMTGHSAIWLSLGYLFLFGINGMLSPFAGKIADRFDRKRVAITSSLVAALCYASLALADSPIELIAIGFVASVASIPAGAAIGAAIPNMVSEDQLDWANGTLALARRASHLIGLGLGGAIAASLGPSVGFVFNAGSYVIEAAIIWTITASFQTPTPDDAELRRGSAFAGFPVIWRDRILRSLFIVWTILFLTIDIAVVADLPIAYEFGWDTLGYTAIALGWAIGGLLGALLARRITPRLEPWAVLVGVLGAGLGYLMIGLTPWFGLVIVGNAIVSSTDAGDEVAGFSMIQRSTADALRGRVTSAFMAAGFAANAVGFTFAGVLVEAFGPRTVFLLGGIGSLLTAPLLMPMFDEHRRRHVHEEAIERAAKP
jgi:MFS family permease